MLPTLGKVSQHFECLSIQFGIKVSTLMALMYTKTKIILLIQNGEIIGKIPLGKVDNTGTVAVTLLYTKF